MENTKAQNTQDVMEMLDLFYANKHMHDRLKRQRTAIDEIEHPIQSGFRHVAIKR